jgi:hypothetical protein
MIDNTLLEAEAAKLGYTVTIDWRNFPNAGPIMELMKSGPEAMSFAVVGNTPVVTSLADNVPLQIVTTRLRSMPLALPVEDCPLPPRRPFASACPEGCVDRHGQHSRHGLALHQTLLFSAMLPPQLRPLRRDSPDQKLKLWTPK